eukprot:3400112-Prymnesium_polylepis.3
MAILSVPSDIARLAAELCRRNASIFVESATSGSHAPACGLLALVRCAARSSASQFATSELANAIHPTLASALARRRVGPHVFTRRFACKQRSRGVNLSCIVSGTQDGRCPIRTSRH